MNYELIKACKTKPHSFKTNQTTSLLAPSFTTLVPKKRQRDFSCQRHPKHWNQLSSARPKGIFFHSC